MFRFGKELSKESGPSRRLVLIGRQTGCWSGFNSQLRRHVSLLGDEERVLVNNVAVSAGRRQAEEIVVGKPSYHPWRVQSAVNERRLHHERVYVYSIEPNRIVGGVQQHSARA